jgi:hypothetical protein
LKPKKTLSATERLEERRRRWRRWFLLAATPPTWIAI